MWRFETCKMLTSWNNPATYNILVFLAWTSTSFLCHRCGNVFLSSPILTVDADDHLWLEKFITVPLQLYKALLLTLVQIAFCSLFVRVKDDNVSNSLMRTVKICHILATFATNASMTLVFASSTFAIKMMEPVTSAIGQCLLLGSPLSPLAVSSLPLIMGGAIMYAGNPLEISNASLGMAAAFLSNIVLTGRHVAFRKMSSKGDWSLQLKLKGKTALFTCAVILLFLTTVLFVEKSKTLPASTALTLVCVCVSGLFHVIYSYVSMALVLTKMSVLSHSIANIVKRLMVVLLLDMFGHRRVKAWNFMGLVCCTLGLLVYAWQKAKSHSKIDDKDVKRSKDHRLLRGVIIFFTCGCFMFGLIGTVVHTEQNPIHYARLHNLLRSPQMHNNQPSHASSSFLNSSMQDVPNSMNVPSNELNTSSNVIKKSQLLHFDIIGKELQQFKYAILFDTAAFENKGDPCITVGELYFLKRLDIEIIYYCETDVCRSDARLKQAKALAEGYSVQDLVILLHGGGNIIAYSFHDELRFKIIKLFSAFKIVLFPQSIRLMDWKHPFVNKTRNHYCCNSNLTLILRDQLSYRIAQRLYNGTTRILMAPDIAFQIGHVPRSMPPVFDILWIKRIDKEGAGYTINTTVPKHLKVHTSDWVHWRTPKAGTSLERAFYIATNGFFYIQRGRVVITDRLHGHILSVLMDIPHVLIDNSAKKLSSYHDTWTKSLENTVITNDPSKALDLAIGLLHKYNHTSAPLAPYLNLREDFSKPKFGVLSNKYP